MICTTQVCRSNRDGYCRQDTAKYPCLTALRKLENDFARKNYIRDFKENLLCCKKCPTKSDRCFCACGKIVKEIEEKISGERLRYNDTRGTSPNIGTFQEILNILSKIPKTYQKRA